MTNILEREHREHSTGRWTLLVMPFMAMAKKVTLRTDPWGTPFSCMRGGDRTVPSWTRYRLLDIKLSKNIGKCPFICQWWRVHKIPYRQAVSYAFSISKKTATRCCFIKKAVRSVPQGIPNGPPKIGCVWSRTGCSIVGLDFPVSSLAVSWPFSPEVYRHSWWDILGGN
jgi:hypothetical protein